MNLVHISICFYQNSILKDGLTWKYRDDSRSNLDNLTHINQVTTTEITAILNKYKPEKEVHPSNEMNLRECVFFMFEDQFIKYKKGTVINKSIIQAIYETAL